LRIKNISFDVRIIEYEMDGEISVERRDPLEGWMKVRSYESIMDEDAYSNALRLAYTLSWQDAFPLEVNEQ
jgi:hypothetical protein